MTPRNLTLFRFPPSLDLSELETAVAELPLNPVGPLELQSCGFVSPFGTASDALVHRIGNTARVTLGSEAKILPGSVVAKALADRLARIEETEGRKLSGRARKRVKEELINDMLPRAFVRPRRVDAYLFGDIGVLAVDASSRKAGEQVVSYIRQALGSFPALPLNAEMAPRAVLTGWLAGDQLPEPLQLGDAAELRDPVDRGSIVRVSRAELAGEEMTKHLEAGKKCARLALIMADRASFTLGDDLVLRKFKLLDGAFEDKDATDSDSIVAEMDAMMALFEGEFRQLFCVLERELKLSRVEG